MSYPIPLEKARDLRSPDNLARLRKKSRQIFRDIVLDHHRDALWPLLRNTDFLNQQVGMSTTTNFFLAQENGGSFMHTQTKSGGFSVAYEELPYIWEAPSLYAVERVYVKGPLKYLQFKVDLEELSDTQTRVTCSIHYVSILPPPVVKLLIGQEIDKFIATFKRLSQRLGQGQQGMLPFFEEVSEETLSPWVEKWSGLTDVPQLARQVAHYLLSAPERLSYRLRPREFAAWYNQDPLDVLNFCLYLVHQGDLQMQWDCRCPGCKGPKESYEHLSDLQEVGYCESCATHYGVAFDQNIELTFSPAPQVRQVSELSFCAGSPGNTPHVAWQHSVPPQTKTQLNIQAPPGSYVLRSPQFMSEQPLSIEPSLTSAGLSLRLEQSEPQGTSHETLTCNTLALTFDNATEQSITLMLENVLWQDLAVTAAQVQCVQMFHDVFPSEALSAHLELPLSHQVFLSLDWQQADTELMEWSQHQLAQFQGALLKPSLTDQHMRWIFASAFDALAAAWALQEGFQEMADFYDPGQELTVSLTADACTVLSQEGHLHYTGPAPEMLSHIAAQAKALRGHNIVVPAALFAEPGMATFLEPENYQVKVYRLEAEGDWVQFQWENPHGI